MNSQFILTACLLFTGIFGAAAARAQNDESMDELIRTSTIYLFNLLPKNDFDAVRALMSDDLAMIISAKDWESMRNRIVSDAGSTPRYVAYETTYYEQDPRVAAVDFFWSVGQTRYLCMRVRRLDNSWYRSRYV